MVRYAKQINGLTEIVLTKLDVLSGLDEIPVCVSYELDGETIDYLPSDLDALGRCKPNWVRMAGWKEDITSAKTDAELPENARKYIAFIAEQVGLPISMVSVGPARSQVVYY